MQGCDDVPETEYEQIVCDLVRDGILPESALDESVRRVLTMKFALGLFEHPYADEQAYRSVLRCDAHKDIMLRADEEGMVLLQNDGVLPLRQDTQRIAVIGPSSAAQKVGGYSSNPTGYTIRSVYDEIKERYPNAVVRQCDGCAITHRNGEDDVQYVDGQPHLTKVLDADIADMLDTAAEIASQCDVAVLVCGDNNVTSGEGMDRSSLTLAGKQRELIKKVAETGVPVVLVLENGKAVNLSAEKDVCNAILAAGFGGEFGAKAIVRTIAGDVNPAGRLSVSFPRADGMVPCYYSRRVGGWPEYYEGSSTPLFPFGHGLSYTRFTYNDLSVTQTDNTTFAVSCRVENAGNRVGDEVVQLYVHDVVASVAMPKKLLKAFKRITLQPGESGTVTFTVTADDLKLFNVAKEWVVEPGDFELLVGASSEDIRLEATVAVR